MFQRIRMWLSKNSNWLASAGAIAAILALFLPYISIDTDSSSERPNSTIVSGDGISSIISGNVKNSQITYNQYGFSADDLHAFLLKRESEIKQSLRKIYNQELELAEGLAVNEYNKRIILEAELKDVRNKLRNVQLFYLETTDILSDISNKLEASIDVLTEEQRGNIYDALVLGPQPSYEIFTMLAQTDGRRIAGINYQTARLARLVSQFEEATHYFGLASELEPDNQLYETEYENIKSTVGWLSFAQKQFLKPNDREQISLNKDTSVTAMPVLTENSSNSSHWKYIHKLEKLNKDTGTSHPDMLLSIIALVYTLQSSIESLESLALHLDSVGDNVFQENAQENIFKVDGVKLVLSLNSDSLVHVRLNQQNVVELFKEAEVISEKSYICVNATREIEPNPSSNDCYSYFSRVDLSLRNIVVILDRLEDKLQTVYGLARFFENEGGNLTLFHKEMLRSVLSGISLGIADIKVILRLRMGETIEFAALHNNKNRNNPNHYIIDKAIKSF